MGKQLQQLVVQYLDFAQCAVGAMENDGAVLRRQHHRRMFSQRHQVAYAVLHLREQRRIGGLALIKQVQSRQRRLLVRSGGLVKSVELAHKIAALAPPGGQQGMGMRVQALQRYGGQIHPIAQRLAPTRHGQQLAAIDGIGPMEAAGIGNGKKHLAMARDGCEHLKHRQRQVRHAKQHDAARQWRSERRATLQPGERLLVNLRADRAALCIAKTRQRGTPEQGLPLLVLRNWPIAAPRRAQAIDAGSPVAQPVGPVDLVLIEKVCEAPSQLPQPLGVCSLQKGSHRLKAWLRGQARQVLHQTPGERRFVHGRARRHVCCAQHLPVAVPKKARRQLHLRRRTNAAALSQRHLEPLGHTIALHQHDFGLERAQGVSFEPRKDGFSQGLCAVALQGNHARRESGGTGRRRDWHTVALTPFVQTTKARQSAFAVPDLQTCR